ncbi:cytochrome aa3 quinol oxidase subunit II [Falsibacillus albus]|uniref:Quinol oxidase subunit 2 n=1 Tax=Falsibacillus albus TaxID=2478915 RepID=A0A3L7JSW1_9BACI|nr:cytochrome aa3 quinol oxidase subunit II [Falsibacillus albus]RLQ93424.1 cytochrome aa3 quinol oxidase subunit II [Falsibacillus albus]
MRKLVKPLVLLSILITSVFLGGCSKMTMFNPQGPVAEQQKDLIFWSIGFMLFIVAVVFILFSIIIVRYRERKQPEGYEPPDDHGNTFLEIIWTVIPIIIVIALSVPTVKTIYSLEKPPKATAHKKPLVVNVTSVDWKWIFSYPEQNIETVNQLIIPEDRPVKFKLTSADSMAAFWVPALGGQEYNMAGMQTDLYLQADHPGVYKGRNANFNGEGFADQKFDVKAETQEDFDQWVKDTQKSAPKLTKKQYDQLMLAGHSKPMTFSSTHLQWVDHAKMSNSDYAEKIREQNKQSNEAN